MIVMITKKYLFTLYLLFTALLVIPIVIKRQLIIVQNGMDNMTAW